MGLTLSTAKDIADVIAFFERGFTVVLALALGEAFKQFVNEKAQHGKEIVNWSCFGLSKLSIFNISVLSRNEPLLLYELWRSCSNTKFIFHKRNG